MLNLRAGSTPWYVGIGVVLICCQLSLFATALPPFHIGIWAHVESVQIAYFSFAVLQAVWCWWGVYRGWLESRYYPHALWWWMHVWILWQIAMLPFAESGWRSWFGHPAHGIGVAWHVVVWITTMMGFALWRNIFARKYIVFAAVCLLGVQACMFAFFTTDDLRRWLPATFAGYLPHMAAWTWVIYAVHKRNITYLAMFCIAAMVGLAVYVSEGRAAIALIFPALFASYIAKECRYMYVFSGMLRYWRMLAAIVVVTSAVAWHVVALQPSVFSDKRGSMAIRAAMHEVGAQALQDNPLRLVTGSGWGSFLSDSFRFALTEGTYVYKDGEFAPYAPLYESPAFHSHDQALEALLAFGLVGLLLWFLFPVSVIVRLSSCYFWQVVPMFVAIIILSYLWFYFPIQLGYVAVGYAALAYACLRGRSAKMLPARLTSLLMLLLAVVMGVSVFQYYNAISYGRQLVTGAFTLSAADYSESWIKEDIDRGGDRLTFIIQQTLLQRDTKTISAENEVQWKNRLVDASHAMAHDPRSSALNAATEVLLQQHLHGADFTFDVPLRTGASAWKASVLHMANMAPKRDDLATPFLLAVDTSSLSSADKLAIYEELLAITAKHRPAGWLHIKESLQGDIAEHSRIIMKQRAFELLNQGLTGAYPITPDEINQIVIK